MQAQCSTNYTRRSQQEYADENEQLKKQVDQLTRRIHELEKVGHGISMNV